MVNRGVSLAVGALLALPAFASGQRRDSTPLRPLARGAAAGAARGKAQKPPPTDQQMLSREVRQRFALVMRRQLNLNDSQFRQLQGVETRFQQQRNQLQRD